MAYGIVIHAFYPGEILRALFLRVQFRTYMTIFLKTSDIFPCSKRKDKVLLLWARLWPRGWVKASDNFPYTSLYYPLNNLMRVETQPKFMLNIRQTRRCTAFLRHVA